MSPPISPRPNSAPQAYFQQAIILGGEQKTDEMLAVMHAFIAAYPDSKDIFYAYDTIGQTQVSQKKIADAVATYSEMAEKHPDNPMAATSLYRAADLWRKAAEGLGHYVALNEKQRAEWNKDIASSMEAGEKVVQQFPDSDAAGLALKTLLDDQRLLREHQAKDARRISRNTSNDLAVEAGLEPLRQEPHPLYPGHFHLRKGQTKAPRPNGRRLQSAPRLCSRRSRLIRRRLDRRRQSRRSPTPSTRRSPKTTRCRRIPRPA